MYQRDPFRRANLIGLSSEYWEACAEMDVTNRNRWWDFLYAPPWVHRCFHPSEV
jgi:hypothetical protein